jgi:hypothetical protein
MMRNPESGVLSHPDLSHMPAFASTAWPSYSRAEERRLPWSRVLDRPSGSRRLGLELAVPDENSEISAFLRRHRECFAEILEGFGADPHGRYKLGCQCHPYLQSQSARFGYQ